MYELTDLFMTLVNRMGKMFWKYGEYDWETAKNGERGDVEKCGEIYETRGGYFKDKREDDEEENLAEGGYTVIISFFVLCVCLYVTYIMSECRSTFAVGGSFLSILF